MSLEEAEDILNVPRGSDFDTILRAKRSQLNKAGTDQERAFMVRAPGLLPQLNAPLAL
jgi:hypothetical protein